MEPFYSQAEDEIGVSGDAGDTLGSPRSAPYPLPAIPQTFMDKAYAGALAGTQFEVRATPQARNSAARHRDLRSHDHRNLFILGSAVFPTSATANSTLTIAALSLRAADQVKRVWRPLEDPPQPIVRQSV